MVLVLSLLLAARREWAALTIFLIFVLVLWLAFFKPTQCDVETDDGKACGNPAHGRLRACHLVKHKRAKNDALWATFRLRNPAIRYRIKWAQPRSSYGHVSPEPEEQQPRLMKPWYDGTMLVATVLVAVVTVATFALQFRPILWVSIRVPDYAESAGSRSGWSGSTSRSGPTSSRSRPRPLSR